MGLDMYLRSKRPLSLYIQKDVDIAKKITELFPELGDIEAPDRVASKAQISEVCVGIGYWRKANQIHDWFVRNVQSGEDECIPFYVCRETLSELHNICKKVLDDHSLAASLLPTADGFFFGTTDYDESYFQDLGHTVKIIDTTLSLPKEWVIEYQSSW